MIDYELFCKIKNLKEQHGLTPAQISRELFLDSAHRGQMAGTRPV